MKTYVLEQSGRYSKVESAPLKVTIEGGDAATAEFIADQIALWRWPGQDGMYEVKEIEHAHS